MKPFLSNLEMTVNLVASDFLSLLNSFRLVFQSGSVFFATVSWKRAASCAGVTDSGLPAANWANEAGLWYFLRKKNPKQEMTSS